MRLWIVLALLAVPAFSQRPKPPGIGLIERLNNMSSGERRKMLDKMPPERRKALETRIDHLNQIAPELREKLKKDYEQFQQLPAERQEAARQTLRQIGDLPADRRPMVRGAINNLRNQPTDLQGRRMASRAFQNRFSDDERKLIKDALNILPSPEISQQQ